MKKITKSFFLHRIQFRIHLKCENSTIAQKLIDGATCCEKNLAQRYSHFGQYGRPMSNELSCQCRIRY